MNITQELNVVNKTNWNLKYKINDKVYKLNAKETSVLNLYKPKKISYGFFAKLFLFCPFKKMDTLKEGSVLVFDYMPLLDYLLYVAVLVSTIFMFIYRIESGKTVNIIGIISFILFLIIIIPAFFIVKPTVSYDNH